MYPTDAVRPEADAELRYRAKVAGTAAADMLNSLPTATFGAALLYISDGYSRTPVDAAVAGLPRTAQQLEVSIFALNPHAFRPMPQIAAENPDVPAQDRDVMLKSLRAIAEPTGGFAVLDEVEDFADALQRIGRAMR
jgi:hypothetical protein